MTGKEFIRKIRKLGRERDVPVTVNKRRGKGSHSILTYGDKRTTVKQGEIPAGTLSAMLKQLGLTRDDIA